MNCISRPSFSWRLPRRKPYLWHRGNGNILIPSSVWSSRNMYRTHLRLWTSFRGDIPITMATPKVSLGSRNRDISHVAGCHMFRECVAPHAGWRWRITHDHRTEVFEFRPWGENISTYLLYPSNNNRLGKTVFCSSFLAYIYIYILARPQWLVQCGTRHQRTAWYGGMVRFLAKGIVWFALV